MYPSSAAGRLFFLLKEGRRLPANAPTSANWKQLLGLEQAATTAELLQRLADVFMLPSKAVAEILQLENVTHSILLHWTEAVERAFNTMRLNVTWDQFAGNLDDTSMLSLHMASDLIHHQRHRAGDLDKDKLHEIAVQLAELRNEILGAKIDRDVRSFMLLHLSEIERAIESYRVVGPEGLRSAVQSAVGAMWVRPDVATKTGTTAEGRKYYQMLQMLVRVVAITADLLALQDGVSKFLLTPPSAYEQVIPDAPGGEVIDVPPSDVSQNA